MCLFYIVHLSNTLALTSFPLWIGSTYGIGLFLVQEDWSFPITHRDFLSFKGGIGGPYLLGNNFLSEDCFQYVLTGRF